MENEQFRVDRMLQAAAERGVRVNVIVYREVEVLSVTCGVSVLTVCR
jgi:phospholipase D1/2